VTSFASGKLKELYFNEVSFLSVSSSDLFNYPNSEQQWNIERQMPVQFLQYRPKSRL
jgi:hypothetical protein